MTASRTQAQADAIKAIKQFLQWGEDAYAEGHQGGYFSGDGWAAVQLRAHLETLESAMADPARFTNVEKG